MTAISKNQVQLVRRQFVNTQTLLVVVVKANQKLLLISDKVDTSEKDIYSESVLKRLGIAVDGNTSSKIKPKEKVSKNSKEAWSYNSSENKKADSDSGKPSSGTSTKPPSCD